MDFINIIHDPREGHSQEIGLLVSALNAALSCDVQLVDVSVPDAHARLEHASTALIFWCATRWYLQHRTLIQGRPFICLCSWHGADLMELINPLSGLMDSGAHVLFTNCAAFIKQSTAALPAMFSLKPAGPCAPSRCDPLAPGRVKFGTVLPNVVDRDFSQFMLTCDSVAGNEGYQDHPKLYLLANSSEDFLRKIEQVPASLQRFCVVTYDYFNSLRELRYYIMVPRITDYRLGITPPELAEALLCGASPLVIQHPAFDPLVEPVFVSVSAYRAALKRCVKGDLSIKSTAAPRPTYSAMATRISYSLRKHLNASTT